jgi:hypothetical protein
MFPKLQLIRQHLHLPKHIINSLMTLMSHRLQDMQQQFEIPWLEEI